MNQAFHAARNSTDAADVLLRDLIDYAGLFPPASLDMASSVKNYDAYLGSEWNWMLGRFIVPAARLGEFESVFFALPAADARSGAANWRLSVLLGSDAAADVDRLRQFNMRMAAAGNGRKAAADAIEVRIASAEEIKRWSGLVPAEMAVYFEIPLPQCTDCIAAVAASGRRAKIRTGGETPEKFPAPEMVIEFIRQCAAANVPFKATAGLHHPLRSVHRLTYETESPSGIMHGFLNVFLAAAFLRSGMEPALAVRLLEEQSLAAFRFDEKGIRWREQFLTTTELSAARRSFALSFGSCSFTEPIDDLRAIHLL